MRYNLTAPWLALGLALVLAACGGKDVQEAERAYKSLKSLQGHTQAGVTYHSYLSELGKTMGEVSVYLERAERDNELFKSLAGAMENYLEAKEPWEIKISQASKSFPSKLPDSDWRVSSLFEYLEGDYYWQDDETAYVFIPGGPETFFETNRRGESVVDLDKLVQIHWGLASKHLAAAGEELK